MDSNEEQRKRLGRSERRPESTNDPVNPGSRDSEGGGHESGGYSSPRGDDRSYDDRSYGENRDDRGTSSGDGREKGTIDKLIDQAQEKGYFDKAERFFRDKFGGGKGGSSRR